MKRMSADVIRIRLFLVSYVPLWAMLAFRAAPAGGWQWNARTAATIAFGILTLACLLDAIRLIRGSGKTAPRRLVFSEVNDQGGNAAGYLATYLLPFIGLVPTDWGDWCAYLVYFIVAALVFIRTDLTFVNPTLFILRHRVVSANAYLPDDSDRTSPLAGSPFVVVCRDPRAIRLTAVDVTSLGGGFVTRNEPRVRAGGSRHY
jgi:hypothetical protein